MVAHSLLTFPFAILASELYAAPHAAKVLDILGDKAHRARKAIQECIVSSEGSNLIRSARRTRAHRFCRGKGIAHNSMADLSAAGSTLIRQRLLAVRALNGHWCHR